MNTENRLTFVDTAKFLAIYFVIISHCSMSSNIAHFLFSFHVPLFFILFGFVHNQKDNIGIKSYFFMGGVKLFYRIIVPYFLLSFILGKALDYKSLAYVLYGSIQSLADVTSTHLWFLPCYFISVILYNLIEIKIGRLPWMMAFFILIFGCISAYFCYDNYICFKLGSLEVFLTGGVKPNGCNFYIGMPLGVNVALCGMVLIYIGKLLRALFDVLNTQNSVIKIMSIILCASLGFIFYKFNNGGARLLAMSMAIYGNFLLFLLTATCLSFFTIMLSSIIDNPIFSKYGKFSFPIYAFHLCFVFIGNIIFSHLPQIFSQNVEIKGLFVGTITLIISCLLIPVIQNIDSNLIGEHK